MAKTFFDLLQKQMSTIAPVYIEFRCNRCWVSNCAESEAVGTEVECRNCNNKLTVPEATPDRIERALALLEQEPEILSPKNSPQENVTEFGREYSDQELMEIARRESFVPLNQMDFQGYPLAGLMARLIANIIDTFCLATSMVTGFILFMWLAKQGYVENPFGRYATAESIQPAVWIAMGLIPVAFVISQWCMIATSGQTIGKKLLMIRIVSESGRLPGFIQGVILRNWVRYALSFIPFFSLIDVLFIFSASRKCLHDYLAGTRVVSLV